MLSAEDEVGTATFPTGRALVLAVGDDVENVKPGDVILLTKDVDLRMTIQDPFSQGRNKAPSLNRDCQITTFKRSYLDEQDIAPCAEIWDNQAKAIDNVPYSFVKEAVDKGYGE